MLGLSWGHGAILREAPVGIQQLGLLLFVPFTVFWRDFRGRVAVTERYGG